MLKRISPEFDGIEFSLEVNAIRFTRGMSNETTRIPRLGESVVSVIATTTLFDLLRQVAAATRSEALEYELANPAEQRLL